MAAIPCVTREEMATSVAHPGNPQAKAGLSPRVILVNITGAPPQNRRVTGPPSAGVAPVTQGPYKPLVLNYLVADARSTVPPRVPECQFVWILKSEWYIANTSRWYGTTNLPTTPKLFPREKNTSGLQATC